MTQIFAVPHFSVEDTVVIDDEGKNRSPNTPQGLQGEKQFFKLLLMVELIKHYEAGFLPIQYFEKFDPIQMFLHAKLFDEIEIT